MVTRSENMKTLNVRRSQQVNSMINLLTMLELGALTHELFSLAELHSLEQEINSYRADKIARLFDMSITKSKLLRFAKAKNHQYELTSNEVIEIIKRYKQYLDDVLLEMNNKKA